MKAPTLVLLMACAGAGPGLAHAAPHAHEHGAVKVEVAIDGASLTIGVQAPLDSLLGFERAPRSDAERRAAADVLARLRNGSSMFSADAAAQCTLAKVEVESRLLQPGARASAADEHADLDASYDFRCARPLLLRTLELGLFDAFKRIQRIEVQVAGPNGQARFTLTRPARTVRLAR